jgi:hypothetical protein
MVNYSNSSIYKLSCLDPSIKDVYVGSTTNFVRRKQQHKNSCNDSNYKNYNCNVYKFIRDNGNWSNWEMIEIEKYEATDKRQLHTRERYWLETLGATLNKMVPNRTKKEYYEDNKQSILEKKKEYSQKSENKEKRKKWLSDNKEHISNYKKELYENNKQSISEKIKEYRENNKQSINEKRKEKMTCECGSIHRKSEKSRHIRSKKHQSFINQL